MSSACTPRAAGRPAAPLAATLGALLAGCASPPARPPPRATLPAPPVDAATVPDAVPRAEPRSAYGNPPFYDVNGQRYVVMASSQGHVERGVASWYGPGFHARNTSSGEPYDMYGMTAAHKTLPIPCYARITNLANGRSVVVRINDRGPFVANRIVDLSYSAALRLDLVRTGTGFVELRTVDANEMVAVNAEAIGPPPALPSSAEPPVVAPITAPPVAAPPQGTPPVPAPAGLSLYIQVGAYGDPANAARVLARLQAAGIERAFMAASRATTRPLQRVRIGPIASVDDYDQLAARLAGIGFPDARLATD